MNSANPTLKTIQRVKECFDHNGAISKSFIDRRVSVNYYSIHKVIEYLIEEGYIKEIPSSSKGVLYIKNE